MEDYVRDEDAEARRSRRILGHILAAPNSTEEPSNSLSIAITAATSATDPNAGSLVTVRIGDVSLAVPRPLRGLSHTVPALYLAGKGQVGREGSVFVGDKD
jgi:hypothetical protein